MINRIYSVCGYFKNEDGNLDNITKISGKLISELKSIPPNYDPKDFIYFGMDETMIQQEIKEGDKSLNDFVITHYHLHKKHVRKNKVFNIMGTKIKMHDPEPCLRVEQFMKRQEITCRCNKCLIDNKNLSNQEIRIRMSKHYN